MSLTEAEQSQAATDFSNYWRHKGDEKSDCQRFWIDFVQDVLGIENAVKKLEFEKRVDVDGQTKFIDVYIPETRTLIEQKSVDKDLNKKYPQSGGWMATPFEQARRYSQFLPVDEAARWIIACNFKSFEIHDMNKPSDEPLVIELDEIRHKLPLFNFMFVKEVKKLSHEMEISVKAGEIVGILYDKLLAQYRDPDEESYKSLNALCVRLVFCLYAEDAGIFGKSRTMFHDYLVDIPAENFRKALVELFKTLDTRPEDRGKYFKDDNPKLAEFPYVNGGLFADENIEIPPFTEELKEILLEKASADFDWSDISPTIFGAVFESTLNPETRRKGGMHYTSIENIHKVIDPLFLDAIKEELNNIEKIESQKQRETKLRAYQDKLSALTFLDPACGSGNFLTETYISVRRLENRVLRDLFDMEKGAMSGQISMLDGSRFSIKVSIDQFYGIEINDFAVTVAKTALWIAESQMMKETENITLMHLDFLPLQTNAYIHEGNALQIDWGDVVPKEKLNYIMGNPPFVGTKYQSSSQKDDIFHLDSRLKMLDYVSGWYYKASCFVENTNVHCAFVSTNSITQGEQVAPLWNVLFEKKMSIDFAYRTFVWDSEASLKAHVHCVIIGFSDNTNDGEKKIFDESGKKHIASNINPYIIDAPNIIISSRKHPICNVPEMSKGSQPTDGGYLLLDSLEREAFIEKYPEFELFILRYMGAVDLINNKERYCFWLKDCPPNLIKKCPELLKRLEGVKESRLSSTKAATRKWADMPYLFTENRQPDSDYMILPVVSSENRPYIPVGYVGKDVIANTNAQMLPTDDKYYFGVIESNVHMAWLRTICGRMKSDYAYSISIVYNNFPWPKCTNEEKDKIRVTAQTILDVRSKYKDSSLADLYDNLTMPQDLRKAHVENDKAVMRAYGFPIKDFTESDCVRELMKRYEEIVSR